SGGGGARELEEEGESLRSSPRDSEGESGVGVGPRLSAEGESLRSSLRHTDAVPARDSLEPLRSAEARSNRGGGGVPGAMKEGGAPRELEREGGSTRYAER